MKPNVFIGCSSEQLAIARAIQANLDYDCYPEIWNQGCFELSKSSLESLLAGLDKYDFAIFILTPDDMVQTRGEEISVTRDNVIFELGLFIGRLGRDRVYSVAPRDNKIHLPSDLLGITNGTFDPKHSNLKAALGPFCDQVRQKFQKEFMPSFPSHTLIGKNILNQDHKIFTPAEKYSFAATIPHNYDLVIQMKNTSIGSSQSQNIWWFSAVNVHNWIVDQYDNSTKSQKFTVRGAATADLEMFFEGIGSADILYYKGGESSSFLQKSIEWK